MPALSATQSAPLQEHFCLQENAILNNSAHLSVHFRITLPLSYNKKDWFTVNLFFAF
jgi:hypothetical protein